MIHPRLARQKIRSFTDLCLGPLLWVRKFLLKHVLVLLIGAVVSLTGCGGGASQDSNSNDTAVRVTPVMDGMVFEDPGNGIATFESASAEILPGVFASRMAAIESIDPESDSLGYRGLSVQKIDNTTGFPQEIQFLEDVPKSFAGHVDQMNYKVLLNARADLDIDDLLDARENFVSIDELVEQGFARVIEEDPLIQILVAGALSIGATYVFFERPDLAGLTPRTSPGDLFFGSTEKRTTFINEQLLDRHCDAVVDSAQANNIPPHLLANIILNEIADYGWEDTLQEIIYTGAGRSHGQVQLQPSRIRNHGLIDIGPANSLRNPAVDIDEADLEYVISAGPAGSATVSRDINQLIYQRLLDPVAGIELAAREIDFLLKMLEPGKPALNNPWAKSLLKEPGKGIDRNDIYANLKVAGTSVNPDEQQIERERSLAVMVIAAYNGSGAIFNATDETQIFTDQERKTGINPWEVPGDIDDMVVRTDGERVNKYPFRDPRVHADNGGTIFPAILFRSPCLDVEDTVVETDPEPGLLTYEIVEYENFDSQEKFRVGEVGFNPVLADIQLVGTLDDLMISWSGGLASGVLVSPGRYGIVPELDVGQNGSIAANIIPSPLAYGDYSIPRTMVVGSIRTPAPDFQTASRYEFRVVINTGIPDDDPDFCDFSVCADDATLVVITSDDQ